VSLPGGPYEDRADDCCVRGDANLTHIWARFASSRMARSLCIAPLDVVPDEFSVTANANRSTSFASCSWRYPKPAHHHCCACPRTHG
jgi:hypothetical protein